MDDGAEDFDRMFANAQAEDRALGKLYNADCLWLVDQVRRIGPDAMPGLAAFAFLSMRQPFYSIMDRMDECARDGLSCRFLYGDKARGLAYVIKYKDILWEAAQGTFADDNGQGEVNLDDLLMCYLKIPGLGIVKASFLAQMSTGQGACMDGINLHRMGLREDHFRHRTEWTDRTRLAKVREYNSYWSQIGDSGYWWDTWCEFQGTRDLNMRGYRIRSPGGPEAVSKLHRGALCLDIR